MSYTLIEPCAGSAAFTLYMLGARRSLLPYQGSKWRFRHSLQACAEQLGYGGRPSKVVLTDPGPWGIALGVVLDPIQLQQLVGHLEHMAAVDARTVYDRLHRGAVPSDPVKFTAEFLFLQRLAFSGKAVGTRKGCWSSPGFNKSSAYGIKATSRFGQVKPMVPSLIGVLKGYLSDLHHPTVEVTQQFASAPVRSCGRTLVYMDPPYVGSTAYPDGSMEREGVVEIALSWRRKGAAVMISEQQHLPLPSWGRTQIYKGRQDTSPFRGKQAEWVTFASPSVEVEAAA